MPVRGVLRPCRRGGRHRGSPQSRDVHRPIRRLGDRDGVSPAAPAAAHRCGSRRRSARERAPRRGPRPLSEHAAAIGVHRRRPHGPAGRPPTGSVIRSRVPMAGSPPVRESASLRREPVGEAVRPVGVRAGEEQPRARRAASRVPTARSPNAASTRRRWGLAVSDSGPAAVSTVCWTVPAPRRCQDDCQRARWRVPMGPRHMRVVGQEWRWGHHPCSTSLKTSGQLQVHGTPAAHSAVPEARSSSHATEHCRRSPCPVTEM